MKQEEMINEANKIIILSDFGYLQGIFCIKQDQPKPGFIELLDNLTIINYPQL